MKYTLSIAVMALLGYNDYVQAVSNNRSMLERAEEEDAILAGTSNTWSDVGFTQTKGSLKNEEIDVNDENTSIQSMSQKKNAENKSSKMKNEINEKENSDKNNKLFKNINEKLHISLSLPLLSRTPLPLLPMRLVQTVKLESPMTKS